MPRIVLWILVCFVPLSASAADRKWSALIYTEPVKWYPAFFGADTYRAYLGIVEHDRMHLLKFSRFVIPHKVEDENDGSTFETPGRTWLRLGYGFRKVDPVDLSGGFIEYSVNFVYWNYYESIYKYQLTGIQPYIYFGTQHLGKAFYISIAVGMGLNSGVYRKSAKLDGDDEAPPNIISRPPFTLIGDVVALDLDFSLGFRI
jgi:hypothetical protein